MAMAMAIKMAMMVQFWKQTIANFITYSYILDNTLETYKIDNKKILKV